MTKTALISQNDDSGKPALAYTLATEAVRDDVKTISAGLDRELDGWMEVRQRAGVLPDPVIRNATTAKETPELSEAGMLTIIDCPGRTTGDTLVIACNVNLALDMYSQIINESLCQDKTVPVFSCVSTPAKPVRTTKYIPGSLPQKSVFPMATTDGSSLTETSCLMLGQKTVAVVDGIAGYAA